MDLKDIKLSEIRERLWYYLHVKSKKVMNNKRNTEIENKLAVTSGEREAQRSNIGIED